MRTSKNWWHWALEPAVADATARLLAGLTVRPAALPVKLVAVTVPAAKLPLASRDHLGFAENRSGSTETRRGRRGSYFTAETTDAVAADDCREPRRVQDPTSEGP